MQEGLVSISTSTRRHLDSRYIGCVVGCYTFTGRRDVNGQVRVFACRARSISADHAVVDAVVMGDEGDRLTVRFDPLGLLTGHIADGRADGFSIIFDCTDEERCRLAGRIDWMKREAMKTVADRREYKRVLPRNPHARLITAGHQPMDCILVDISRSGAAISAQFTPPLGTAVAVGAALANVVRHLEFGFAVQFRELHDLDQLEVLLRQPLTASTIGSGK